MTEQEPTKNILILDDSEVALGLARVCLERAGYFVSTALTIDEFHTRKASHKPDLILLDIQMPGLDGDDVGAKLREEQGLSCPILLHSAMEDDIIEAKSLAAGLDGHVSKNSGPDVLLAAVRAFLDAE